MLEINLKVTRLRRIELRNLLPFGPKMEPLALENLNILIGPNTEYVVRHAKQSEWLRQIQSH